MWIVPPNGLREIVPAPVIWVEDIGAIALDNGIMTICYYSMREPLDGGAAERTLEVVIKRPAHRLIGTFGQLARVLEAYCGQPFTGGPPPRGGIPTLVP